jgi:hypothetical protein
MDRTMHEGDTDTSSFLFESLNYIYFFLTYEFMSVFLNKYQIA